MGMIGYAKAGGEMARVFRLLTATVGTLAILPISADDFILQRKDSRRRQIAVVLWKLQPQPIGDRAQFQLGLGRGEPGF